MYFRRRIYLTFKCRFIYIYIYTRVLILLASLLAKETVFVFIFVNRIVSSAILVIVTFRKSVKTMLKLEGKTEIR